MQRNLKPTKTFKFSFQDGWLEYLKDEEIEITDNESIGNFLYFFVYGQKEIIKNVTEFIGARLDGRTRVYGCKLEFDIDDKYLQINENIISTGFHLEKNKARKIAAFKAIEKIRSTGFNENMPNKLIGFPNYRGHCFAIPALVPLFNHQKFVDAMRKLKSICGSNRTDFQVTSAFYELYQEYLRSSRYGDVKLVVYPVGIEKKADHPSYSHFKETSPVPKPSGKLSCLDIDQKMMQLVAVLRDCVDTSYATPGGHHAIFLMHILSQIKLEMYNARERNPLTEIIFCVAEISYRCKCRFDNLIKVARVLPFISVKAYHDKPTNLQDILNDLTNNIDHEFYCEKKLPNDELCGDKIYLHKIESYKLLKTPEILIFHLSGPLQPCFGQELIELPEEIEVQFENSNLIYKKFALSYIVRERMCEVSGEESSSLHTYVVIKGFDNYNEVNNSSVEENNPFKNDITRTTGENIVFYRINFEEEKCNFPRIEKNN